MFIFLVLKSFFHKKTYKMFFGDKFKCLVRIVLYIFEKVVLNFFVFQKNNKKLSYLYITSIYD